MSNLLDAIVQQISDEAFQTLDSIPQVEWPTWSNGSLYDFLDSFADSESTSVENYIRGIVEEQVVMIIESLKITKVTYNPEA